jgi:hypothetical protein
MFAAGMSKSPDLGDSTVKCGDPVKPTQMWSLVRTDTVGWQDRGRWVWTKNIAMLHDLELKKIPDFKQIRKECTSYSWSSKQEAYD